MKLYCSLGTMECNNENQVEETIKKCADNKHDEIWLNIGDYPCLTILTNGKSACIQFSISDEKSFYAIGDEKSDSFTSFYTDGMLSELPNSMVVSLTDAIACAKQFFTSRDRSPCVKWDEN